MDLFFLQYSPHLFPKYPKWCWNKYDGENSDCRTKDLGGDNILWGMTYWLVVQDGSWLECWNDLRTLTQVTPIHWWEREAILFPLDWQALNLCRSLLVVSNILVWPSCSREFTVINNTRRLYCRRWSSCMGLSWEAPSYIEQTQYVEFLPLVLYCLKKCFKHLPLGQNCPVVSSLGGQHWELQEGLHHG